MNGWLPSHVDSWDFVCFVTAKHFLRKLNVNCFQGTSDEEASKDPENKADGDEETGGGENGSDIVPPNSEDIGTKEKDKEETEEQQEEDEGKK